MGEPAPEQAEDSRRPDPPPYFSRPLTVICTLLVAALVVLLAWPSATSPLLQLDRPEESLERLVSSELDFRAALEGAAPWERALHGVLAGSGDSLEESLAWYVDLTETLDAPRAEIYLGILLAESGQPAPEDPALASAGWMRAAYGAEPLDAAVGRAAIAEVRDALPAGWFADTLVARLAERIGDEALRARAEESVLARGAASLRRSRLLAAGEMLLLLLGLVALAALITGRARLTLAGEPPPAPWSPSDGYALFVRGVLGLLGIGLAAGAVLPSESLALRLAGFLSGVPVLWWSARYLSARGSGAAATFGLRPGPGGLRALLLLSCPIIALGIAGDLAVSGAASLLGLHPHWADGLPEELLWDAPWLIALGAVDGAAWTPVVEEVTFRGLLYGTLRGPIGVVPATLLSAILFAAAHGYGPVGFASALWSGILWAAAYQKTRSLLPGILAHGVNNLMVTVTYVCLYRMP